jgi:dTDP-4-dehydrorhamnose reductase
MLGRALRERLPEGVEALFVDLDELDVTDSGAVAAAVADFGPGTVLHCAAMTDVDGCETDPERARLVNVEGTRNVASACGDRVRLVHVSTDFVFEGEAGRPYDEEAATAPISEYGRTKLEAERLVRGLCPNHAIARTAWTFAPWGRNFVRSILRAARERGSLRVVTDQVGSPTYALDSAEALWRLASSEARGTFHVVNSGIVSRCEFAREICMAAGLTDVAIEPIRSADLGQPARRPAYSALANTKLPPLRDYHEALADCLRREGAKG